MWSHALCLGPRRSADVRPVVPSAHSFVGPVLTPATSPRVEARSLYVASPIPGKPGSVGRSSRRQLLRSWPPSAWSSRRLVPGRAVLGLYSSRSRVDVLSWLGPGVCRRPLTGVVPWGAASVVDYCIKWRRFENALDTDLTDSAPLC